MTHALHTLRVERHGPVGLAVLTGEIDGSNAATIAAELAEHSDGMLVVDLSEVAYLDSAGMAMLEQVRRSSELVLVVPEESVVHRAMVIVGFDQLARMVPSVEEALANAKLEVVRSDVDADD
jgi:anti-anti-sigma factor